MRIESDSRARTVTLTRDTYYGWLKQACQDLGIDYDKVVSIKAEPKYMEVVSVVEVGETVSRGMYVENDVLLERVRYVVEEEQHESQSKHNVTVNVVEEPLHEVGRKVAEAIKAFTKKGAVSNE